MRKPQVGDIWRWKFGATRQYSVQVLLTSRKGNKTFEGVTLDRNDPPQLWDFTDEYWDDWEFVS